MPSEKTKDVGNLCCECGRDTSFGSGRFVNRIPGDRTIDEDSPFKHLLAEGFINVDGYLCPECLSDECDRCGEMTCLDEQVHEGHFEDPDFEFHDKAYLVCFDCLTDEEQKLLDQIDEDNLPERRY